LRDIAHPIVCPVDQLPLTRDGDDVACSGDHRYTVRDEIPLLLVAGERPTQEGYWATGREVYRDEPFERGTGPIDPYVRKILVGTCGNLYTELDRFTAYPIPELRLPPGEGRSLLDVGSNWGRWTLAAAQKGYRAVGVDPSLGAVQAGYRVAEELGVEADFLVGDARHLPFPDGSFDVVFSYGVLQHFSEADAVAAIREMGRVVRPGGTALLQMPGRYGLRNLQQQARRGFSKGTLFEVRYWPPARLRRVFEAAVGPARLEVDGFLTLNPQAADLALLPPGRALLVRGSEALRRLSRVLPLIVHVADSVYVRAVRPA
jgi:SAM-dependent methyltransferase